MRTYRTIIAALAFCLLGLVPMAASSATAAEPTARAAAPSTATQQLAKPARNVKFEFRETRNGYKFYGKVQDANRAKVLLMRADDKRGNYRLFKTTRTSARGTYTFGGLRKAGWYYVKVPGNAKWATSYSNLIHVYYR